MPTARSERDASFADSTFPRPSLRSRCRSGAAATRLLLLLAVSLIAIVLWYALDSDRSNQDVIELAHDEPAEQPIERLAPLTPPIDSTQPEADLRTELAALDESGHEPRASATASEDSGPLVRLVGSVELPPETPQDELPMVIALDREMTHQALGSWPSAIEAAVNEDELVPGLLAVTRVAADQTYAIEVPADRSSVHLALVGRYLAPLKTTRVRLPQSGELPLLQAQLGMWITGRVGFPEGTPAALKDFSACDLEMLPDVTTNFDAFGIQSTGLHRKPKVDEHGSFEAHAVIESGKQLIAWQHESFSGGFLPGIEPRAGEHLELTLEFEIGGSISGKVVDEFGHPIAAAQVASGLRGILGQAFGNLRETESDEQGVFTLQHLPPGDFILRAEHPEFKSKRSDVTDTLERNGRIDGVMITLDAGARLFGHVRFPDGSPAADADVKASFDFSGQVGGLGGGGGDPSDGGSDQTGDDGSFEIRGLGDGPFHLEVDWNGAAGSYSGAWGLRKSGLLATGEPLTLELEQLGTLIGEVVDQAGTPVAKFEVHAVLEGSGAMFGIGAERKTEQIRDSQDGRFALFGLRPGTWKVVVHAEGFASSDAIEVSLPMPDESEPQRIALQQAAIVAGQVVDSLGAPVAGARVSLHLELAQRVQQQLSGGSDPVAFSGEDGRFVLEGLQPVSTALIASSAGFASSAAVPVELTSGRTTSDVTLALRTGGTLTGVVLTAEGEPRPGRSVIVQRMPTYDRQHILESGADGSFAQDHLEPGSWQVVVMANLGTQGASGSEAEMLGDMIIERVTIEDGVTTHLVLGLSDGRPIEVSGRVTHAGEGVANSVVSFVPEDSESIGDLKMTSTNKEGLYKLQLPRRGSWLVTVQNNVATGRQNSIEYSERMPDDADTHTLNLELPGGRITGKVVGPKGKALANCRITLNVEGGIAYGSFLGGHYTETVTDSEGAYEIRYLRAGRYAIAAGGPELGGMFGDEAQFGRTVRGGIEVGDGEWLTGVDFRLKNPGDLTGVVLGATGQPLAGAAIFLRDATGRMVERFSLVSTDPRGAFTYRGLAPGSYTAFARSGGLVSADSSVIEVRSGATANVELRLEEGCVVKIKVRDKSDTAVRARVSIVDGEGREHTGAMSMTEIMEQFGAGFSSEEQRVGPLALGRYHVRAVADDGREAESMVSLTRAGERSVLLRLK